MAFEISRQFSWLINHSQGEQSCLKFTGADYAPIQATSVPSEQVFSSLAETDTKCRNRTSAMLMEALQMLKFNYKKSRLNFILGTLADTNNKDRDVIWREIVDSCNSADGIIFREMPEENDE
ncbi:hypothetical protein B0H14DRAFT_2911051 [Mycena olivaceomarginata]|nr:hypothetical protein B0H14DRAFT_2911051 [Mycena olivaceomarginata]